jgi:IS30 family transposase
MARGYHHVTRDKRSQIEALQARGCSIRSIAKQLGCDPSTISREIKRNSGKRGYRIEQADRKARERRLAASQEPKKMKPDLVARLKEMILAKWGPQQIVDRLKIEEVLISHETIYRMVWADKRAGGILYKYLRHHGKRYNKRSSGKAGRGCIPGRIDISERPKIVEEKSRIGDWEGDTIIGAKHQGAIVSYVDRHSKFTLLKKIERKEAALVVAATLEKMKDLPHKVETITFDNGKEFARHQEISIALTACCYFAQPYHSWERGLNEHTNGLVRQFIPKWANIHEVPDEFIEQVQNSLNHRPRKILEGKTPYEVFFGKENFSTPAMCFQGLHW